MRKNVSLLTGCKPAQARELATAESGTPEEDREVLRPHDVWAAPLDALLGLLQVEVNETEMPTANVGCILTEQAGKLDALVSVALNSRQREEAIRAALCAYLAPSETARDDAHPVVPGVREDADPAEPLQRRPTPRIIADLDALYQGTDWGPMRGWQNDQDVITALMSLVTGALDGLAREIAPEECPFPEGVGGAVTWGYRDDGEERPCVFVRADLPSSLRADLWGFCIALACGARTEALEPDEHGIVYVGLERHPVARRGAGLLGALMVQRFGRRPGHCSFGLLTPPQESTETVPLAA
jgi:hypothetical protein